MFNKTKLTSGTAFIVDHFALGGKKGKIWRKNSLLELPAECRALS